jgi:hypothetical protein
MWFELSQAWSTELSGSGIYKPSRGEPEVLSRANKPGRARRGGLIADPIEMAVHSSSIQSGLQATAAVVAGAEGGDASLVTGPQVMAVLVA